MSDEKSLPPAKMDFALEGRLLPPGRPGDHLASGINQRGNSCIGNPYKIAPVFDGTNRAEIEVVSVARRIFPPSVVGDHADKAFSRRQVAGAVRAEDRFIADNRQYADRRIRRYKIRACLAIAVSAGVSAELQGVFP